MRSKLIFFGGILLLVLLWWWAVGNPQLHNEPETGKQDNLGYVNLTAPEALQLLKDKTGIFLVDVHTPEQEHLAQTDAFIPFDEVSERQLEFPEDKATPILVYCRSGNMSIEAAEELVSLGYRNVSNLAGGIHAWQGAGLSLDWR